MPRCRQCWRRVAEDLGCSDHPHDAPTGSVPAADSPTAPTKPTIDGLTLSQVVGEGGFATVWLARDENGGEIAVKVARSRTTDQSDRIALEARALAAVGGPCPRFVAKGSTGDGRAFVAMECIDGRSLAELLTGGESPAQAVRMTWARELATAICAVKSAGWVHCDLKAENVIVPSDGSGLRLIDLGVARPIGEISNDGGVIVGSVETMAPEQLRGDDLTSAVDVYAFGVVLYELLTDRPPFVGPRNTVEEGHLTRRPPAPSTLASVVSELEALCLQCLAKEPGSRPHAEDLAARLDAAALGTQPATPSTSVTATLATRATEPAVIVAIHLGDLRTDLSESLSRARGLIVRQSGELVLCLIEPGGASTPSVRALEFASETTSDRAAGNRATIHIAPLSISMGRRRKRVRGPAMERPESWLAIDSPEPILVTDAAAAALGDQVQASETTPGFWTPAQSTADVELIGRDAELSALLSALETSGSPTLVTIVSEAGLGRSRLVRELIGRRGARQLIEASGSASDLDATLEQVSADGEGESLGARLRSIARESPLLVVLDDAHRAEDELLDALEYATLDGTGVDLVVVVTATPMLRSRRPQWAKRADNPVGLELAVLSEQDATELAAAFLRPADYLPRAFLLEIARFAGCSPALLRDVAGAIKREGQLVKRGVTSSFTVAPAALRSLRSSPIEAWLVQTKLNTLSPEVAAFARVVAVIGQSSCLAAINAVLDTASRRGDAGSPIDTAVGLRTLARAGILESRGDGWWSFQRQSFRDALSAELNVDDRAAIRSHAFEYWHGKVALDVPQTDDREIAALAEAATEIDDELAARALLTLGDRAAAAKKHVEAESQYSAVIELPETIAPGSRFAALVGRGSARYRMHRTDDAIADFDRAAGLASTATERADVYLEAASAFDWADRHVDADAKLAQAISIVDELDDDARRAIEPRYAVARGRSYWRLGELESAIEWLERSVAAAADGGADESLVAASLLLAPARVFSGDLEAAEVAFEDVIRRCEANGDLFHLATALSNRSYLWSARQAIEPLIADLDRAVELARIVGQPILERAASHNLSEFLHWNNQGERALTLAIRADRLRERFLGAPQVADSLLLARIHIAGGDMERARAHLAEARGAMDASEPPAHTVVACAIEMVLEPSGDRDWGGLLEAALDLPNEESLEVAFLVGRWATMAKEEGARREAKLIGEKRLSETPIWRDRWLSEFTG